MSGVLVTGASGFVGRHLCRALHARSLDVVPVGLQAAGEMPTSTPIRQLDVTGADEVEATIAEVSPDAIVHLAAWSSAGESFRYPRRSFDINLHGTLNVLEAARAHAPAARILVVGSAEVYGPCAPGASHDEEAPFRPVSPYAASKACQDLLTAQYVASYDLDAIRIRPFSHTGPGQRPIFALPSFAHQIAAIEQGLAEPELRVGRLDVERDYTDVRDVVDCYCEILLNGSRGAVLNVCSGRGNRLDRLLEQLLAEARVPIRVNPDAARMRPADLPRLVGNPGRVRQELGWQAKITMDATLADLIEEARAAAQGTELSN